MDDDSKKKIRQDKYNKKMKSTVKQDYFIITSPQDELKQISLSNTVEKASYESQRPSKRSNQRFAIDSWDISQKLKPFQNQTQRYKENLSTNLSPKPSKRRYRAKSAFLSKDLQNTNSHNFNSRKKGSLEISTERKASLFFCKPLNSIQKAKISLSLSRQSIKEKKKVKKSRNTLERQLRQEQQTRTKTIQSYLTHQKQMINRQKHILMSQRIGKQGIVFSMYPTQYWQSINTSSPIRKNRKLKMSKTPIRNSTSRQQKSTVSPVKKMSSQIRIQDCQQSRSTESQSPIKRFHNFREKLHQIVIH